jgi:hypothetical protein
MSNHELQPTSAGQEETLVAVSALRGWLVDTGRMEEVEGQLAFRYRDRLGDAFYLAHQGGEAVSPGQVAVIYDEISHDKALNPTIVRQVVRAAGTDYTSV